MLQLSVKENRSGIRHLPYLPSPMKSQPSRDHTATETKDWQHAMGLNDFYEFIKNVFWKLLYLWGKRQSVGQWILLLLLCICIKLLKHFSRSRRLTLFLQLRVWSGFIKCNCKAASPGYTQYYPVHSGN